LTIFRLAVTDVEPGMAASIVPFTLATPAAQRITPDRVNRSGATPAGSTSSVIAVIVRLGLTSRQR